MILRQLQLVRQEHANGCFVACFATLAGLSYRQAFKIIHPTLNFESSYWSNSVALTPEESIQRMNDYGLRTVPSSARSLRNLRRTAMVMIRWEIEPTTMHAIIYDASSKKFLDPGEIGCSLKEYQRQVDTILYFNSSNSNRNRRDERSQIRLPS